MLGFLDYFWTTPRALGPTYPPSFWSPHDCGLGLRQSRGLASQWSWKLHRRVLCPTRFVSAMQFGVLGCPKWKVPQWYLKNNPESSKTKVFSQRTAAKFNFPLHLHNTSYSLDITYITCIIYINSIYSINFLYIYIYIHIHHLHVAHHLYYLLQLHLHRIHHLHHLHHLQQHNLHHLHHRHHLHRLHHLHHLHHLHQHHLHGRVLANSWHVGLYPLNIV